jgi:hypothetical protein
MTEPASSTNLFIVQPSSTEPILAAAERAMHAHTDALAVLPTLTNVALGDPYLAQQVADLHAQWEVRPPAQRTLLGRVRARVAWWLLGREMQQINRTHATLVRLLDSLIVQLDEERAARRRLEEQRAYSTDER